MNRTEAIQKKNELLAIIYWHNRGTFPKDNIEEVKRECKEILHKLIHNEYPKQVNERGNFIERGFKPNTERYYYDFEKLKRVDGWEQYDTRQDAWYFGVWVNATRREIFTFAEGDTTLVTCPTLESFRAELAEMEKFYGPPPPAFIACDGIGLANGKIVPEGNVTLFFDKRPTA